MNFLSETQQTDISDPTTIHKPPRKVVLESHIYYYECIHPQCLRDNVSLIISHTFYLARRILVCFSRGKFPLCDFILPTRRYNVKRIHFKPPGLWIVLLLLCIYFTKSAKTRASPLLCASALMKS